MRRGEIIWDSSAFSSSAAKSFRVLCLKRAALCNRIKAALCEDPTSERLKVPQTQTDLMSTHALDFNPCKLVLSLSFKLFFFFVLTRVFQLRRCDTWPLGFLGVPPTWRTSFCAEEASPLRSSTWASQIWAFTLKISSRSRVEVFYYELTSPAPLRLLSYWRNLTSDLWDHYDPRAEKVWKNIKE